MEYIRTYETYFSFRVSDREVRDDKIKYVQGVSGRVGNILGGGSMDYSE